MNDRDEGPHTLADIRNKSAAEDERKLKMYRAGEYMFEARYLYGDHARWTDQEWVNYINTHGAWMPTGGS